MEDRFARLELLIKERASVEQYFKTFRPDSLIKAAVQAAINNLIEEEVQRLAATEETNDDQN